MTDDSAEILFQSVLQEAIVSCSGASRDVHSLMLSIFFIASVHSFKKKNTFKKSGIDKSTEWSTIPACPSLMYFFFFLTGVILKGLIFRKVCVQCLCMFCFT